MQNLTGIHKSYSSNGTPGEVRYTKNGKFIIIGLDGKYKEAFQYDEEGNSYEYFYNEDRLAKLKKGEDRNGIRRFDTIYKDE